MTKDEMIRRVSRDGIRLRVTEQGQQWSVDGEEWFEGVPPKDIWEAVPGPDSKVTD